MGNRKKKEQDAVPKTVPEGTASLFDNSDPDGPLFGLGMMTIDELAVVMHRAPGTIRNWVARREIPFIRFGGRTVFLRDSVREWLLKKEVRPHGRC